MNSTSFQSSTYNHKYQAQIHGQSGLKVMDGEDLTYGDRKRLQCMQSDAWWRQQMEEREKRANRDRMQKNMFDEQILELAEYRKQLEEEKQKRLRDVQIATRKNNLQQLDEKLQRDYLNRQLDESEKLDHINYINNNDFYTQNPDTCQSALSRNRVLPYHWKGMSDAQRRDILEEQEKQRKQKQLQKQIEAEQNRLFDQQLQAQRKAIVLEDRAKNKGNKNIRKGMDEYNRLKAEEMKKKAYNAYVGVQTYKNQ